MKPTSFLALVTTCFLTTSAVASTITVNSIADVSANDGQCTLREAITAANTNTASGAMAGECVAGTSGLDTIEFKIPAAGVKTITPASALPTITEAVIIDGYTQPGARANTLAVGDNAVLLIELNGTSTSGNGLILGGLSGGSTIRGLVINRFASDTAIKVVSGNNVISGCFIGVDPAGNTKLANAGGVRLVTGANNLIGGTTPAARNVLSGNNPSTSSSGGTSNVSILYEGGFPPSVPLPTGTLIRGNYIGTTAAGTATISDPSAFGATDGVLLTGGTGTIIGGADADDGAPDGNVMARNLISGNLVGISTRFGFSNGDVTIQGNFIGVNANGTAAIGNYSEGINFNPAPQDGSGFTTNSITVGGTAAGAGNVISGTIYGSGILTNARNVLVQGNHIGTDVGGTLDLGNAASNGGAGIQLLSPFPSYPVSQITIGGASPAARNIISGNGGAGIFSSEFRTTTRSLKIQGNFIGTQGDGLTTLGNDGYGIYVLGPAMIGGTNSGEGNVIAYNGIVPQLGRGAGIVVPSSVSGTGPFGITILGNSIFSNRGLGIDLGGVFDSAGDGVTPNDLGDTDTGPNGLQNFPVLTSTRTTPSGMNVVGTLNSLPNATYRLEFFGNTALDPTLYGEGRTYLGFTNVTTDGNGNVAFDAPIAAGGIVTSTATDAAGNTSEFSLSVGQLLNISSRLQVGTGDNVLIAGFIITGTQGKRVIIRGIGPSLTQLGIPGALADPTLELHDGSGALIAFNDNWKSDQQAEIEATTIAPTNELEAAIVRTLPSNNSAYSAVVRGKDNSTGIGVVEAYDLDAAADSRLANISTRGFVNRDNDILIGGYIVGSGVAKVIIRAIGPSLADAGVTSPLQDPTLELHNASGATIATNDNWKDTQQAEIIATGIPPRSEAESAIVATLLPGGYSAVVRGKNNSVGVAVVEVYNIP